MITSLFHMYLHINEQVKLINSND